MDWIVQGNVSILNKLDVSSKVGVSDIALIVHFIEAMSWKVRMYGIMQIVQIRTKWEKFRELTTYSVFRRMKYMLYVRS